MAATAATVAVAAVMVVAGATRMSDAEVVTMDAVAMVAVVAITDAVAAVASALAWAAVAVAAAAAAMLTDAAGATRTGTEPTSSGHPERPEKAVSGQLHIAKLPKYSALLTTQDIRPRSTGTRQQARECMVPTHTCACEQVACGSSCREFSIPPSGTGLDCFSPLV
jgi:hypothetical protein